MRKFIATAINRNVKGIRATGRNGRLHGKGEYLWTLTSHTLNTPVLFDLESDALEAAKRKVARAPSHLYDPKAFLLVMEDDLDTESK